MASAIIGGLLANSVPKTNITVSEPWEVNRNKLAATGVNTTTDNVVAGGSADLIIIAVKPQVTKAVCEELAKSWADRQSLPVVVSIAAGITLSSLQEWSTTPNGARPHVVRVMPNTPALVAEGASGAIASADVSVEEKALVNELLGSVSKATEWVDKEELLDVVTGLSGEFQLLLYFGHDLLIVCIGSGPAYFFAMVEHLVASATALGLSQEQATRLATQTCLGAGKMLVTSDDEPGQLRKNVTSPNGTTFAALQTFEKEGFKEIVDKAVKAATDRAAELGNTLAK